MTSTDSPTVSVIIPAHNEAGYLGRTLEALFASEVSGLDAQAIVVANGCTDDTAAIAQGYEAQAQAAGWALTVVDSAEGGKPLALDLGEAEARGRVLIYLDADVIVSPGVIAALARALDTDRPLYGGGTPIVTRSPSAVTRAYTRMWTRMPFFETRAPGFGLFAINRAGRARWGTWPRITGDDAFARLVFAPEERVQVAETYDWPPSDGFFALVRVRRRQDQGVRELMAVRPDLEVNEDKVVPGAGRTVGLFLSDPVGWLTYAAVKLASKLPARGSGWARGR
ncbi:MAG: glycosyltransferase family 2 protein [Maritimibacter sp.]|nr:glycosyltransferase family 2 protein [Maritimibacter sp.]